MTSLFDSLGIAVRSLQAQQAGLEVTQRNIANAATPGYSRQRVNLVPGNIPGDGFFPQGSGPAGISIDSFRDRFSDQRIVQELNSRGKFESMAQALRQVETFLNENADQGLGRALSEFFNSFEALSSLPEDRAHRQQVLSSANHLAQEFGRIYEQLQSIQVAQNRAIPSTVEEINALTESIARLNVEVVRADGIGSPDAGVLKDQRQIQLEKLAELISISFFETESGAVTVLADQGPFLVLEDQNNLLQAAGTSSVTVTAANVDITSQIRSGKLAGFVEARDGKIAQYLEKLDDLAAGIIARVNAQHGAGIDLSGSPGGDLFTPFVPLVPGSNEGAARSMAVAISDPNLLAAAEPGTGPGNNANALLLAGIADEALFSGSRTVSQFYTSLIFDVGADLRLNENSQSTQDQLLTQLRNQRDSVTGVNLDEEAVNIIKYQKAYEASARFARTIDSLTEELIRLLGN